MFENIGRFIKRIKSKSPAISTLGEEITVRRTEYGTVNVELGAVARVANRAAAAVDGIDEADVTVEKQDVLKLRFKLGMAEGRTVQEVSSALVESVRGELERHFGIVEVEIYVRVESVKKAEKPRRRVR